MTGKYNSLGGRIFDVFNYTLLGVFALCTVLPFLYILGGSFATETELTKRAFFLIPHTFSMNAYDYIFSTDTIFRSFGVSAFITIAGTLINMLLTVTMAYPLSRKNFAGRNFILNLVIFTMLFSGGMIPTFLTVKDYGMLDSFWSLIFPTGISAFNMIIIKNFFQQLPAELEESARMDGCTEMGVLFKIILPLSKPVIATFSLFYAVYHWNDFFQALLYINSSAKWPLQVLLRQIVMLSDAAVGDLSQMDPNFVQPPEQSIKMAVIIVATIPMLIVYPFVQKHFTKGILIGAVKG